MVCLHTAEIVGISMRESPVSSSPSDWFLPFLKGKSICHPQQVQDCFASAGSKPVASSSSIGTLSFTQAPLAGMGWWVQQPQVAWDPTAASQPGSASGGLGSEARYRDGSFLTGEQVPRLSSAVLGRAVRCFSLYSGGLIRGLQRKEAWAPLKINRQALIKCLLVYNLLAA